MSFKSFIAQRIYSDNSEDGERFSRPAVRIAMLGVMMGVAVMLISLAVVLGFKEQITSKVMGFGCHVQALSLTQNQQRELLPLTTDKAMINSVRKVEGVKHVQPFACKLGVLKTEEDFRGVNFKGVGADYDMNFLQSCLVEGEIPSFKADGSSGELLISRRVAADLGVKTGDKIFAYFMGDGSMRARRFKVAGLFVTNMDDYDKNTVITDIYTVRKLNQWRADQSTGLEISVNDVDKVEDVTDRLQFLHRQQQPDGIVCGVFSIKELAAHTFAWLSVLDMNVVMILILMILVSAFTVVSGLLIIMLERISMIGTLKVLGATNSTVRGIFVRFCVMLVGRGLLYGNLIGLAVCLLQKYCHVISLDPSVYYIDSVPISFDWLLIIAINLITFIISLLIIWGSSHLISLGKPSETLRFE
ncbi:MAG: ABC transporter permease [Bacteroidaceae bacterium]|nr:ABC transporter permease [Bacteroidaceae bacterium]